jgi:hypothetical protein
LKVLTVWQPWASLIAIGAKPFEFRGWTPPKSLVGQRIAIQAGARKMDGAEVQLLRQQLSTRPWATCLREEIARPFLDKILGGEIDPVLGAIVCTAVLGMPRNGLEIAVGFGMPRGLLPNDSDRDEHANFGWPLSDIQVVMPPVPFRGKQGWGEVSDDLLESAEVAA